MNKDKILYSINVLATFTLFNCTFHISSTSLTASDSPTLKLIILIIIIDSDISLSSGSSSSDEHDLSLSSGSSRFPDEYEIVSSKGQIESCSNDDDDSSDDDFLELKVKKDKTCKGKSLKSTGCKIRAFNSSKTKVVCKPKTVKIPFLYSSDEDMSKSSKS
ncbi:hypothetical protein Tco_1378826 [Tanacetum coccineum]